jgi:hypothetical protein
MKRWNREPMSVGVQCRGLTEERLPTPSCLRCRRPLPREHARTYCLEHSEYPQAVARRVEGRRLRRTAATLRLREGGATRVVARLARTSAPPLPTEPPPVEEVAGEVRIEAEVPLTRDVLGRCG